MYDVKTISKMLNVQQETVRRWIRSGKLKSTKRSKKEGNLISESDLNTFLIEYPKYEVFIGYEFDNGLFVEELKALLKKLTFERNRLDEQIEKIQKLIQQEETF